VYLRLFRLRRRLLKIKIPRATPSHPCKAFREGANCWAHAIADTRRRRTVIATSIAPAITLSSPLTPFLLHLASNTGESDDVRLARIFRELHPRFPFPPSCMCPRAYPEVACEDGFVFLVAARSSIPDASRTRIRPRKDSTIQGSWDPGGLPAEDVRWTSRSPAARRIRGTDDLRTQGYATDCIYGRSPGRRRIRAGRRARLFREQAR